jgi:ArsR family transcriptional regulator, arsenate/arsenite/antimonite-responsive transcriptional repressor
METQHAIAALGALAQETRLAIFRLLVERGPEGLAAGAIGERLGVAATTLSFHLQQLMHADLIEQRRESRSLIYSAKFANMNALVGYLTENCCGGAVSCGPVCAVTEEAPPARARLNLLAHPRSEP